MVPAGASSTPHSQDMWLGTQGGGNRARRVEAARVTRAKALIIWYTLIVELLPGPNTLTFEVYGAWFEAIHYIADA